MDSLRPFLQGTYTPYNMPVYPGAQCNIAYARSEPNLELCGVAEMRTGSINAVADGLNSYRDATSIME
jgi:hypothetical protein